MKKGDTIYYVKSDKIINEYVIDDIAGNDVTLSWKELKNTNLVISLSAINKKCIFDNYNDAYLKKEELSKEFEEMQNIEFEKILDEALNATTLPEVESNGTLLKSKKTEYEKDSYGIGGTWMKASLYEYKNKKYLVVYSYNDYPEYEKKCVLFREYIQKQSDN